MGLSKKENKGKWETNMKKGYLLFHHFSISYESVVSYTAS